MQYSSEYAYVQAIAKSTIDTLQAVIQSGITEKEIVQLAEEIMKNKGIRSFWYYDIGAFVHVGTRSTISESGKTYQPSDSVVSSNDVITIDLSPEINDCWGDYARTLIVHNGHVLTEEALILNKQPSLSECVHGIIAEKEIHQIFTDFIQPDMTFEEVYLYMNKQITQLGYVNLDFAGNLGHTIECHKDHRQYFEAGNHTKLGDNRLFTFEPHIKHHDGSYGFKREDIYYFCGDTLKVL